MSGASVEVDWLTSRACCAPWMTMRGRNFLPPGYNHSVQDQGGRRSSSVITRYGCRRLSGTHLLDLDSQYLPPLRTLAYTYKLNLVRECARELVDEDRYILEAVI